MVAAIEVASEKLSMQLERLKTETQQVSSQHRPQASVLPWRADHAVDAFDRRPTCHHAGSLVSPVQPESLHLGLMLLSVRELPDTPE